MPLPVFEMDVHHFSVPGIRYSPEAVQLVFFVLKPGQKRSLELPERLDLPVGIFICLNPPGPGTGFLPLLKKRVGHHTSVGEMEFPVTMIHVIVPAIQHHLFFNPDGTVFITFPDQFNTRGQMTTAPPGWELLPLQVSLDSPGC